jgi:hypothetical protein
MTTITIELPDAPSPKPAASAPRPQSLPPKPEVLIVAGADGHIEVYTSRPMRVHFAERLDAHPDDEIAADDYLDATLPAWARAIYFPWDLAACWTVRPRTAREELARRLLLDLVREAAAIASSPARIPVEVRG